MIAFARATSQGTDIAVVRPDRTGFRTLIHDAAGPAWSADGRSIAFDRKTARGDSDLFVANADGSGERQLDHPGADDFAPSWSPDGSQLTYTDDAGIYVVNADGTNRRALTSRADDPEGVSGPVWSPSGEWIAFITKGGVVTLIHPDGSDRHDLDGDGTALNPSWSPDGTKLAYDAAGVMAGGHLHRQRRRHQRPRSNPLSRLRGGTRLVAGWQPDRLRPSQDGHGMSQDHADLYVINADGSDLRPLVRGRATKWGSDWQPAH